MTMAAVDNGAVRLASWPASAGAATILFLNGRADFIEKYSEAYWHWRDRGLGLVTFDWRGQGLSPAAGLSRDRFEAWLGDLDTIIAAIAEDTTGPLVLAGHSMGGHLALRWLARNAGQRGFRRALLFAPMAGIATHGAPGLALAATARLMVALGRGDRYPPGQGPYGAMSRSTHRQRRLTSDADRFADEGWWIDGNPALASNGATWSWIDAALASCRRLAAPGAPERIDIPVDIFMGANEQLVDVAAARAITARLRAGSWHEVPGAAHELLREASAIQANMHAKADRLLAEAL